jgi:hypothetical protein
MNTRIRSGFTLAKTALIAVSCIMLSCNKDDEVDTEDGAEMELNFQFVKRGAAYENSNVYVSWIENIETSFIQNITVCERLVDNTLTGIVLPYWKVNKYPSSKVEADAISSATIKDKSFNVDFTLKDSSIKEFSVYFELDRSNEYNDWFTDKRDQGAPNYVQDQPAILYKADVNLNDPNVKIYELELYAWTPNDETENIIEGMETGTPVLETRYITCKKNGETFGDWDNEHRMDRMVGSITLTIK